MNITIWIRHLDGSYLIVNGLIISCLALECDALFFVQIKLSNLHLSVVYDGSACAHADVLK